MDVRASIFFNQIEIIIENNFVFLCEMKKYCFFCDENKSDIKFPEFVLDDL